MMDWLREAEQNYRGRDFAAAQAAALIALAEVAVSLRWEIGEAGVRLATPDEEAAPPDPSTIVGIKG